MTTRQSAGTRSRKVSSAAAWTTDPVGLFGLQTKIRRVRSVIAAAIASRSCAPSRRGTSTGVAPERRVRIGYASKERQAYMTSAPGSATASRSIWETPTEPQPTAISSSATPKRADISAVSATQLLSG